MAKDSILRRRRHDVARRTDSAPRDVVGKRQTSGQSGDPVISPQITPHQELWCSASFFYSARSANAVAPLIGSPRPSNQGSRHRDRNHNACDRQVQCHPVGKHGRAAALQLSVLCDIPPASTPAPRAGQMCTALSESPTWVPIATMSYHSVQPPLYRPDRRPLDTGRGLLRAGAPTRLRAGGQVRAAEVDTRVSCSRGGKYASEL